MGTSPGLQPLRGSAREIEGLVATWLGSSEREPLWVRTSGSTGGPKDVALSERAIRASAHATHTRLGGPGGWVLALPAHYVAGLQVIVRSLLAGKGPVILAEHESLAAAAEAIAGGRRYLSSVPTQLTRWLATLDDVRALRRFDAVLVGGGPATDDLIADAAAAGVRVVRTYGMSETCGGCVYDGVPLDGVSVQIDPSGRIQVSGPVLFDEYVGKPGLTAQARRGEWLLTPDLGRFDAGGRLEVLGRVDDVVVSGGVKIPLGAVERVVSALPEVAQACVVGVPDAEWGTRVVAVVVPDTGGGAIDVEVVRDAVAAVYERSWAPRELVLHDRLPMLESGKVDRQAVLGGLGGPDG